MNSTHHIVLVVDDDPAIRRWLSKSLDDLGYDVVTAHDRRTATMVLDATRVDVMMLDLHLGDESGFDVLRFVRASDELASLPVLILTGHAQMTNEEEEFIRRHRAYVFYKPSPISEIKKTLDRVFSSTTHTG